MPIAPVYAASKVDLLAQHYPTQFWAHDAGSGASQCSFDMRSHACLLRLRAALYLWCMPTMLHQRLA